MNMQRDKDAYLLGQLAALVGVLSVVMAALPPSVRKQLPGRIDAQIEPLIALMLADSGVDADDGREGAEMVRDLFLDALGRAA